MSPEERHKASVDLTLTYINSYYPNWRLTKVLTNGKLLDEKYDFFKEIAAETKQVDDSDGEATITQEIQHGLYFDSIAHCVQYVEDLFALIEAAKNSDYFIRNIVTYNAGKITNSIKVFKPTKESVAKVFHFPHDLEFSDPEHRKGYDSGVDNLVVLVRELIKFYNDYWFFYNQYKHGLAVAMRPLGNLLTSEVVEQDKEDHKEPHFLVVYDNFNLKAASKKGTFREGDSVMMPGFSNNVRPLISQLEKANNFLRFVFPKDTPNFSHNLLIDIARKARMCVNIFITNYAHKIHPEKDHTKFLLPADHLKFQTYTITYGPEDLKPNKSTE